MGKPIATNPTADLPANWVNTQIISATGTEVGLSAKHGYNYQAGKINEALTDIGVINDFCGKIQPVKLSVTLSVAGWTLGGTVSGKNYYTQAVTVSGYTPTAKTKPDIAVNNDVVVALISSKTEAIYFSNNDGSISAVALKNAPTSAITVDMYLSEVDA